MHPKDPVNLQAAPDQPATGNTVERGFREGILITRNDIYRGNLIYQGFEGTRFGIKYLKRKSPVQDAKSAATIGDAIPVAPEEPAVEAEAPAARSAANDAGPSRPVPESPLYASPEERAPFIELGVFLLTIAALWERCRSKRHGLSGRFGL
jgi:hypothetical protein